MEGASFSSSITGDDVSLDYEKGEKKKKTFKKTLWSKRNAIEIIVS